ncbi:MAG TPA: alpha/beta hydrolase [Ilumatobacteraceae bacterium]|nr:alpha/beta hydrolase [Ilumatobacteraceae bacterium]
MRRTTFTVIVMAALAACSNSSPEPPVASRDVTGITDPIVETRPDVTSAPEPLDYVIEWTQLSDRVDEGTITVPLDYADPQGDTIDLYLARHRATADPSAGPLLANRGGPGADGATLGLAATSWFGDDITDNFDVIGWDPRGVGQSEGAVDCIDDVDYDAYFSAPDITPDDDAERAELVQLAEEYAQACIDRVDILEFVGTNNSARDIDAIRQALGVDQVSYFGFSYGSELGGVWATLFPTTVRAAVFDGSTDPNSGPLQSTMQQGVGFEASLTAFLAQCSSDSQCPFHNDGDAEGAFDRLMGSLDESPLPSVGDRVAVNRSVAVLAVAQAMYSERFWPALERALEDAAAGDGAALLQLHDAYYRRKPDGTYDNLIEALQAILCADDEERPTVEEADANAAEVLAVAPRIFPYTTGSYSCTFFPPALDPRVDITGAGAGPIVVIGTTGDPATPLDSSRAMADTLEDGRLVVVEANEHTGYRGDDCVRDIVHEYLLTLVAPDDGTICS